MDKFQIYSLIITAFTALFTGTAALFSWLAVRKASESNKIAMEQYKDSTRPVLDFITKNYKVNVDDKLLKDWNEYEEDLYLPNHLSNSYIELYNIGNKTARNVRTSFTYEGMDHVKDIANNKEHDLFESKGVKLEVTSTNYEGVDYDEYWFYEETNNRRYAPSLNDIPFIENYGSIHPLSGDENNYIKVYLPKLFVYLSNIFSEDMVHHNEFKIYVIFKLYYTDPSQNRYVQRIRIENRIRKRKMGSNNEYVGQLIPEELENKIIND